jgi:hypothetical protein
LTLDAEWSRTFEQLEIALDAQESPLKFIARVGCRNGVSGYVIHTVAAVLFCWLRWPGEFQRPLEEVILLGGDADTTGALLGGIAGASCSIESIPAEWINRIIEGPYSIRWMTSVLSHDLKTHFGDVQSTPDSAASDPTTSARRTPVIFGLLQILRNLAFLTIVLYHGFRRLLPPY